MSSIAAAASEICADTVTLFSLNESPQQVAEHIAERAAADPLGILRRRVRQRYTWQAIFKRDILPLLNR